MATEVKFCWNARGLDKYSELHPKKRSDYNLILIYQKDVTFLLCGDYSNPTNLLTCGHGNNFHAPARKENSVIVHSLSSPVN